MDSPKKIATYVNVLDHRWDYEIMSKILLGIHRYISKNRTLAFSDNAAMSLLVHPQEFLDYTGDGIIGSFYEEWMVKSCQDRGIKIVSLTENLQSVSVPVVVSDNRLIGRLAAQHLWERGYRRFGFVGLEDYPFSEHRLAGFRSVLEERGFHSLVALRMRKSEIDPIEFQRVFGGSSSPIGIMAADDSRGVSTQLAALACNLRVPHDVAVVGVNDHDLICDLAPVPLTSIAPAYSRTGYEAAALLDKVLRGEPFDPNPVRVPPVGVSPRMSTELLAFEDPLVEKALRFILANLNQKFNVDDVVRHCGKSRRTLEMRFVQGVGRPLHEEINRLRVERARQLLTETDWSIGRIADECGFGDGRRLNETFVRTHGSPPKQYRLQNRESENV